MQLKNETGMGDCMIQIAGVPLQQNENWQLGSIEESDYSTDEECSH